MVDPIRRRRHRQVVKPTPRPRDRASVVVHISGIRSEQHGLQHFSGAAPATEVSGAGGSPGRRLWRCWEARPSRPYSSRIPRPPRQAATTAPRWPRRTRLVGSVGSTTRRGLRSYRTSTVPYPDSVGCPPYRPAVSTPRMPRFRRFPPLWATNRTPRNRSYFL